MSTAGADRPAVAAVTREAPPPAAPRERTPRRRRRRWPIVLVVVLLVLVVLAVVAFLVADRVLRDRAETQIEQSVQSNLPVGVTGRIDAEVGGAFVIPQLLRGEFDRVDLTSRSLRVAGAPASAKAQLYGLPTDGGRVAQVNADLTVGQDAFRDIPALTRVNASAPSFGRGTVATTVTQKILTLPVKVRVVLKPSLAGGVVLLSPSSATITAGPASIPATAIVQQLLPNGVSVCAASYLPQGVVPQYLRTDPGTVTVGVSAFQVDLNTLGTAKRGTCG